MYSFVFLKDIISSFVVLLKVPRQSLLFNIPAAKNGISLTYQTSFLRMGTTKTNSNKLLSNPVCMG